MCILSSLPYHHWYLFVSFFEFLFLSLVLFNSYPPSLGGIICFQNTSTWRVTVPRHNITINTGADGPSGPLISCVFNQYSYIHLVMADIV